MNRLKLMFQAVYSPDAIYELRKTPIFISLVIAVFLGIAHMSPFALMFLQDETYRFDQTVWQLESADEEVLMTQLPADCQIENSRLTCTQFLDIQINENVQVRFNGDASGLVHGLVFLEDYFIFIQQGQQSQLAYQALEGMDFGSLGMMEDGYEQLFTAIAQALRPALIVPLMVGVYQTGILTFFIYVFVVAGISMLLKFGHSHFVTFKEMLNIIIFSSILPIVIVIVLGVLWTPGFSTIIFNMGTPLMAFAVYRRNFGNLGTH